MYLHYRLSPHFTTEVIPEVPAFAAATAVVATPLVRQTEVIAVLPRTLAVPALASRLADTGCESIMKLGRRFTGVVDECPQDRRLQLAGAIHLVTRAAQPRLQ